MNSVVVLRIWHLSSGESLSCARHGRRKKEERKERKKERHEPVDRKTSQGAQQGLVKGVREGCDGAVNPTPPPVEAAFLCAA